MLTSFTVYDKSVENQLFHAPHRNADSVCWRRQFRRNKTQQASSASVTASSHANSADDIKLALQKPAIHPAGEKLFHVKVVAY